MRTSCYPFVPRFILFIVSVEISACICKLLTLIRYSPLDGYSWRTIVMIYEETHGYSGYFKQLCFKRPCLIKKNALSFVLTLISIFHINTLSLQRIAKIIGTKIIGIMDPRSAQLPSDCQRTHQPIGQSVGVESDKAVSLR